MKTIMLWIAAIMLASLAIYSLHLYADNRLQPYILAHGQVRI